MDLDDKRNEKAILNWLKTDLDHIKQQDHGRLEEIRRHIAIYRNQQFSQKVQFNKSEVEFGPKIKKNRINRMVINHIYDMVEQHVSRLVKFKPNVTFLPLSDEYIDKEAAKVDDVLWKHIRDTQKLDIKNEKNVRLSKICGEGFLAIEWDPDAGEESPSSKKLRSKKEDSIVLRDENGEPEKDESGNVIRIRLPIRVGDVIYRVVMPWKIFHHKAAQFEDVEYMYEEDEKLTEKLRFKYPDRASDIKESKEKVFDYHEFREMQMNNETQVFKFVHKKTKEMPDGREIVFTRDTILENKPLKYEHGDLPYEKIGDIEQPGQARDRSFIVNIRQMAAKINDLTSMIVRNQALMAHPKWFVPRGSVKIDSLGNDATVVQYTGAQPPVLASGSPTSPEVFAFRDQMKEDMQLVGGIFGVSRGEPPPGIKAGIALQFLEEQENQRMNAMVVRYNEYIRRVAKKTLDVAAQFYDVNDGRMLQFFGPDKRWTIQKLDTASLSKPFTVKIQNSSALPESRAARIQTVLDLGQTFPDLLPQEQIVDMLDIGKPDKFFDAATSAVRTAQLENENIILEKEVHAPQEWEYHIEHWQVHVQYMQSPDFLHIPEDRQNKFKDHVRAHEMFMIDLIETNPVFGQRINLLKQFPLLMSLPVPPQPVAPEGVPQPGGSGGEALVAQESTPQPVQEAVPAGLVPGGGQELPIPTQS
jgi:hypothetical protein